MTLLGIIAAGILLPGCATSDLPRGARLVGGGLRVDYRAPTDGTAILRERTSGRIVATESLEEGDGFKFHPNLQGCSEVLFAMFAPPDAVDTGEFPQMPTNTFFELYFVPARTKAK